MRSSRWLLTALFLPLLAACGQGQKQEAIKTIPSMNRNCEWLQTRFDEFAQSQTLCQGLAPEDVIKAKSKIGGAVLDRVHSKTVQFGGNIGTYYQYDFTFRSRSNRFDMTILSKEQRSFEKGEFYSIDFMNACRFDALPKTGSLRPKLLPSFKLPIRLACL